MFTTKANYLLHDSRQLIYPSETLFFAIKGDRHDGHHYITELYDKGVREFVIEANALNQPYEGFYKLYPDATFHIVDNSIQALQALVLRHRQRYSLPVIAITGSNGKTIVKEWLGQMLNPDYQIVKSPKSYNSQIGVPLSVWQINENHTLGIFEAGVSISGEMKNLQKIINPTIGIFTNIGSAHDEGFRSRKQKISEKLQLFVKSKKLIYCSDYEDINSEINIILKAINPDCELVGWGKNEAAKWKVEVSNSGLRLSEAGDSTINIELTINDQRLTTPPLLENLLHCIVTMLELGIETSEIQKRIDHLRPIAMRLEIKEGINDCFLIDDTYNNDLVGLTMALNFLEKQEQRNHRVAILSDVLQTGQKEEELYEQIAHLLVEKQVHQLIAIGEAFERNRRFFSLNAMFYKSTKEFLNGFSTKNIKESLILVKGARSFLFEKIVHLLQQKNHATVLEISLDALINNLNFYRNLAGRDTKIMVMVKAFAYGSGSIEVAQLLQFHRVNYLAVAYADEGVLLRQNGIELPIMVMNPSVDDWEKMKHFKLEPEIYSFKILDELHDATHIHLKIDTGMHRLGFVPSDVDLLLEKLKKRPFTKIVSIFSHLAGADDELHNKYSAKQFEILTQTAQQIEEQMGYKTTKHILNSAGIVRFPDYKLDMVRLGIGLYGVEVNGFEQKSLQNVGTLKTVISQIKHLKAGQTVGYNRKGVIEQDQSIATIAIGYADGFDRRFSNGVGQVWVNGTLCPVIGNVCMDMTMIDITHATAQEGDEVIVFGTELPINILAKSIGTIPYEIMTGISERVKRVFFKEQ